MVGLTTADDFRRFSRTFYDGALANYNSKKQQAPIAIPTPQRLPYLPSELWAMIFERVEPERSFDAWVRGSAYYGYVFGRRGRCKQRCTGRSMPLFHLCHEARRIALRRYGSFESFFADDWPAGGDGSDHGSIRDDGRG